MKYFEACKIWNEKTKSSQWCIPKKGSKEYEEVIAIMKGTAKEEVKTVPVEMKKENTIEELGIERNIKLDKLIQRTLNLWNNRNESIKLITDQKTTYDTATNKEKDDFIQFILPQQLRQLLPKHLQNITFDQLLPIFKKYVKSIQ